jgi:TolB-like protein/DNA-binding winged helix-turn-helix (wHTH) protein
MDTAAPKLSLVRFGDYELDLRTTELRKAGIPVRLQNQPARVLALLVGRGGAVVTREDIVLHIWGSETFVDFEHGLNSAIRQIRSALRDDPENPSFLETVPKRGYRFIAKIEIVAPDPEIQLLPTVPPGGGIRPQSLLHKPLVIAGILLSLIVAGIAGFQVFRKTSPLAQIDSLAVLPLTSGTDLDAEYLSDGIADGITNSISRLPNLRVMARSTVAAFKERQKQSDPRGFGRGLNVRAVLTSRLTEHGDSVDVEAELVDVSSGAQLWGKHYSYPLAEVFAVQEAISEDVSSGLRPRLTPAARNQLARVSTRNGEAYRLYLTGRYLMNKWTEDGLHDAADFFRQAIAKDQNYASAYAGLADDYAIMGYFGYLRPSDAFNQAEQAGRRAVSLQEDLSEAHISLALVDFLYRWNYPAANDEIQRALQLDPNSAWAHIVSCWYELGEGNTRQGVSQCQRAVELDPVSLFYMCVLDNSHYFARDYDGAIQIALAVLQLDASYPQAYLDLASNYSAKGMYKEAVQQWLQFYKLTGRIKEAQSLKRAFDQAGYPGYLRQEIVNNLASYDHGKLGSAENLAEDYAALGDKDAAFEWLENAYSARAEVSFLKVDPSFDGLRSDPRYADLLRRMGLPK